MAILKRLQTQIWRLLKSVGRCLLACGLLAFAMTVLRAPAAGAVDAPLSEDQIKAAFLASFPKYVEWPESQLPGSNAPIVIAVLGNTKLAPELAEMVADKSVNNRPLVFKQLADVSELDASIHVLFLAAGEHKRWPAVLERIKRGGILTVGESNDFLETGGMIRLSPQDRKIKLEVNLDAATGAGLKISSKLLAVARVVKNGKEKQP